MKDKCIKKQQSRQLHGHFQQDFRYLEGPIFKVKLKAEIRIILVIYEWWILTPEKPQGANFALNLICFLHFIFF